MTAAGSKKNVVLISLDDAVAFWKYKTIFGETLETPNLDRICAQSTAFHNAYCQAPVCSPSRASFMSGLSPHQTDVTGSDKNYFTKIHPTQMWPYALRSNGFFCSSGGKVMRGYTPLPGDIHATLYSDRRRRFKMDKRARHFPDGRPEDGIRRAYYGGLRGGQATMDEKDDGIFFDHSVAKSALMFLERYRRDAPFYRDVGFGGPHGPWFTPRRFKDMYTLDKFQPPAAWAAGFDACPIMDEVCPENLDIGDLTLWQESMRNYFSAMTHVDHHLGRVWDAIKASPHADNTLIVLVSDHGFHLGERNRFRKHTLWEQVANVPLIVHDPDNPVGQIIEDPVALLDVGPTVLDYLGRPPLEGRLGKSLRPQIDGARVPDRVIPTFFHNHSAIRKDRYRFIRYDDGTTQFFDLENDWWQTKDLGSDHPDYAAISHAHDTCCKEHGFDIAAARAA